jgi:NAD(P)-dependent dehydrogenase (short-subunit alcohol dehydrogenase family)
MSKSAFKEKKKCHPSAQWLGSQPDPEATRRQIEAGIPFGQRMTTTEEIADMVTFLLSPQSSRTTGQLIHVDGEYVHLDRALGGESSGNSLRRSQMGKR